MARTLSGCWLISTMPPALSAMGPKMSIVSTYAAVDSMPIVATAVPNRPSALDSVSPAQGFLPSGLQHWGYMIEAFRGKHVRRCRQHAHHSHCRPKTGRPWWDSACRVTTTTPSGRSSNAEEPGWCLA